MSERDDEDLGELGLDAWRVPAPPPELVDQVMARVDGTGVDAVPARELTTQTPVPRRRWGGLLAAALGGAVLAAGVALVVTRGSTPSAAPVAGQLTAAAPSVIALAPGTTVEVAAGAALSWRLDDHGALHVTQTAGAITYQQQGGRHLVVHAGSARVEVDRARFHVEVPMKRAQVAGLIGAAVASVVVVAVYEGRAALSTTTGQVALDAGSVGVAPPADPPVAVAAAKPIARDVPTAPRRFASAADRTAALDELAKARARREIQDRVAALNGAAGAPPVYPGGMTPPDALPADDVRGAVRGLLPLLGECYTHAAPEARRGGELVELVALLTVSAEPDVGTVVLEATFPEGDAALLGDTAFTECLHETLLSLELPPLTAGGEAEIRYPFAFAEEEPEDDDVADDVPDEKPRKEKQPEPEPEPDSKASTPATAADFISQSNDACRSGHYGKCLQLAEQAIKLEPDNQQALTAAAIAACNLKDERQAVKYLGQLSGQRRGMILQVCKRNGVQIDEASLPSP